MPLHRGTSKRIVSTNIHEMVAAGHPQKQAVAAALHKAHPQGGKMAEGGEPDQGDQDHDQMLDQVADELLQAIETKDKKMLVDALEALITSIQQEDQEQDQQMEPES